MPSNTVFRLTQDWLTAWIVSIMLMAKEDSIREVIAFPKVKDASCLMSGAPDVVDPKQLAELDIAVIEKKQDEKKTEE